jgi:hypothetical protein
LARAPGPGAGRRSSVRTRQEHDEEGRGVDGAVVRDEDDLPAGGQLAAAIFVQDLARFLIGEGVVLARLPAGQEAEGPPGQLRGEGQQLMGRDQAVPAEWGDVPGDARIGHGPVRRVGGQHFQIDAGALDPAIDALGRGADLDAPQPVGSGLRFAAGRDVRDARQPGRGRGRGDGGGQRHALAGAEGQVVPGGGAVQMVGPRAEGKPGAPHDAVEPSIGQLHRVGADHRGEEFSPPGAGEAAHLEHVDEVGSEAPGQDDLLHVGGEDLDGHLLDEEVPVEGEAAAEVDGAAGMHGLVGMADVGVGEIDGDLPALVGGRRAQEQRALAVDEQLELPEVARVVAVEAELALTHAEQVAAAVGDEERVLVLQHEFRQVGGDAGGADVVLIAQPDLVAGDHAP